MSGGRSEGMSGTERTLLSRIIAEERGDPAEETPETTTVETHNVAASRTHIGGEDVDVADPQTSINFDDEHGMLSGEYGRPRPRQFWTAQQLGQTPPMELLKNAAARQLIGGQPIAEAEDELRGPMADFADVVIDIYEGPHFQAKTLDNLLTDAVGDMLDFGFAYWEFLPSSSGEFPIAAFKPLPPLQIQHNLDPDTGEFQDDPAYWHVPHARRGGSIRMGSDPTPLAADEVVAMRDPLATSSSSTYGQSVATKVREWLELIIDVDVHQKRFYSDSQLPAGFLHFVGNISDDQLKQIEQDLAEASGDPHDLVTSSSEGDANWIPMGDGVVDLDAIQEQQWYFKLVYAAAGLNLNELGVIEGSGFAKETPALQRAVYKNLTKPLMGAIFGPQNTHTIPLLADALGISEVPFDLSLERFDPHQEAVEREETLAEWSQGAVSLNEVRGQLGREAVEFPFEVDGETVDLADTPRRLVDLLMKRDRPRADPTEETDTEDDMSMGQRQEGPPDFDSDPVLTEEQAFEALGAEYTPAATRQLEDTIDIKSSFIESVAYAEPTMMMQIEFEREGPNAIYWYGNVPRNGAASFFGFIRSASKGSYFNSKIRHTGDPGYPYARVQ